LDLIFLKKNLHKKQNTNKISGAEAVIRCLLEEGELGLRIPW
jgi:hypothetical protein